MLECGVNFKGRLAETCTLCQCRDDENHRLNICPNFKTENSDEQVDFQTIHSENTEVLSKIISQLTRIWNTKNAHGTVYR